MEICQREQHGFIEVWMTNEEQQTVDRKALTAKLLEDVSNPKCKVVFFLSGDDDLEECMEDLLSLNL